MTHHAFASVASPRATWRDAWRWARQPGAEPRNPLDERASGCLLARMYGQEEEDRGYVHPMRVGLVERRRTGLAIRILERRGWTRAQVRTLMHAAGTPDAIVRAAAIVLRKERAAA